MANGKKKNGSGIIPWEKGETGIANYGEYAGDKHNVKLDKIPVLHLVQFNSPEFTKSKKKADKAAPGDVVLRYGATLDPENPNIGQSFRAIAVARGVLNLWWPDRKDEDAGGAPLHRSVKGDPVPQGCDEKDLLFPADGGNERTDGKKGPVADQTHTFVICILDKDDNLMPPVLLSYSRGSMKAGNHLQTLLNGLKEGTPDYAGVLEFTSEQVANSDGEQYFVLKAAGSGMLEPSSPLLPALQKLHQLHQPSLTPKSEQAAVAAE